MASCRQNESHTQPGNACGKLEPRHMDLHFGSTRGSPRHPWVQHAPRTNKLHTRGLTMSTFPQFQRRQSVTTSHFELFVIQMQFLKQKHKFVGKCGRPCGIHPESGKWPPHRSSPELAVGKATACRGGDLCRPQNQRPWHASSWNAKSEF